MTASGLFSHSVYTWYWLNHGSCSGDFAHKSQEEDGERCKVHTCRTALQDKLSSWLQFRRSKEEKKDDSKEG